MFLKNKYRKNYVKVYEVPETGEKLGLIAINGDLKNKLIEKFSEQYALEGDHIKNGGKASPIPILTLLGGGVGSLGITAATSGTLFMATANPATLMTIGSGVGSAVMGASGIVGQAPFIAVAGALMPVAAPLLAFQTLTTIMILNQFKTINEKLANIEKTLNRVLQRQEATLIGEVISACLRIENFENEFAVCNKFTEDMIIRLALVEYKINPIFERYKYLYETQNINKYLSSEDLKFKQTDAYMAIIISIINLRIDVLRLKLTIQENPGYIKYFAENLVSKVERYQKLWTDIENSPKRVEEVSRELKDIINSLNYWKRNMPAWLGGKRKERKEREKQIIDMDDVNSGSNVSDLIGITKDAMHIGSSLLKSKEPMSLLYWEDKMGKHSYYTSDLVLTK